jgi:hypothetical protein
MGSPKAVNARDDMVEAVLVSLLDVSNGILSRLRKKVAARLDESAGILPASVEFKVVAGCPVATGCRSPLEDSAVIGTGSREKPTLRYRSEGFSAAC